MLKGYVRSIVFRMREYFADKKGTVSVDFIISIPILLAVLVLTSEYGKLLQARSTLDNAVADATRYLSRLEVDPTTMQYDPLVIAQAEQLITSRINSRFINIRTEAPDESGQYPTVSLSASVGILSPALGLLNVGGPTLTMPDGTAFKDVDGFVISATNTIRHFGR